MLVDNFRDLAHRIELGEVGDRKILTKTLIQMIQLRKTLLETEGRTMAMTEENKKIYEELKEKYKDDPRALRIIEARAKDPKADFEEVKGVFELLY